MKILAYLVDADEFEGHEDIGDYSDEQWIEMSDTCLTLPEFQEFFNEMEASQQFVRFIQSSPDEPTTTP